MRAVPLRAARMAGAPTKLALLERLLGVVEVGPCVELALAWLGAHTPVSQAICALADTEAGRLRGVAGHRVAAGQVESLSIPLDDTTHPLIGAMESTEPIRLGTAFSERRGGDPAHRSGPFGRNPYWVLPLGTLGAGRPAGGVLLAALNG